MTVIFMLVPRKDCFDIFIASSVNGVIVSFFCLVMKGAHGNSVRKWLRQLLFQWRVNSTRDRCPRDFDKIFALMSMAMCSALAHSARTLARPLTQPLFLWHTHAPPLLTRSADSPIKRRENNQIIYFFLSAITASVTVFKFVTIKKFRFQNKKLYYQSKRYRPVLVVQQGGGL